MGRPTHWWEVAVDSALAPLRAVAQEHGCEVRLAHHIEVSATLRDEQRKRDWSVWWCVEMDGRTFSSASLDWAPPEVTAELMGRLGKVITSEGWAAKVAEAITKIPRPNGTQREYPRNFWE